MPAVTTGYPRADIVAEVEKAWRALFPNASEANLRGILDFEMKSVELHRKNLVPLVRGHGVGSGARLLDFGSGPGASATAMAYDLGADVTGVEPNADVAPIARLWPRAYGVEDKCDFVFIIRTQELPYDDETFDFVVTSSSLEYIPGDRSAYLREMVRVLKKGGKLLVCGTSNAAWPREVHSGTWLLNWMPNLGKNIRDYLGRNPQAERGVTFGEILAACPELEFVRGESDELEKFSSRLGERFERIPPLMNAVRGAAHKALLAADRKTTEITKWPMEAFLPWLNVGFVKR